jgi:hypothetical protein
MFKRIVVPLAVVIFLLCGHVLGSERHEDVSRRDMFSRHYVLPDGTMQAEISSGPIHYRNAEGRWLPIDTRLVEIRSDGAVELSNETNPLRSRFAAGRVRVSALSGEEIEIAPSGLTTVRSGRRTVTPNAALLTIPRLLEDGRSVEYPRLWGHGSRSRFDITPGRVKESIVLDYPPVIDGGVIPEFYEFGFDLTVPDGWSLHTDAGEILAATVTRGAIELWNRDGEHAMVIDAPVAWDSQANLPSIPLHYTVTRAERSWKLAIAVPSSWLHDPARLFPVTVDPTVSLPDQFRGYLRSDNTTFSHSEGGLTGAPSTGQIDTIRSWFRWNISTVPDAAQILQATSTNVQLRLTDASTVAAWYCFYINLHDFVGTTPGPYGAYDAAVFSDLGSTVLETSPALNQLNVWSYTDPPSTYTYRLSSAVVTQLSNKRTDGDWFQLGASAIGYGCLVNFGGCLGGAGLTGSGCTTANHTLNVTYNHPPSWSGGTSPPDATIPELQIYTFQLGATDPDLGNGDYLTFSLVNPPAGMTVNQVMGPGNIPIPGLIAWTPTELQGANPPTRYDFTVRVTDSHGAYADEPVTLWVSEVNTPPVLGGVPTEPVTIPEMVAYTFTATKSDSDLPAQPLTFSLAAALPASGMSFNPSTGVFSWTPTEEQGPSGPYTFTIRLSDGIATVERQVTINVLEVNRPPVMNSIWPISFDLTELSPFSFSMSNPASDPDIPPQTLTFSLAQYSESEPLPAGLTINPVSAALAWTPSEAQGPGTYRFWIRVSDGLATDQRGCTLIVSEANVAPVLIGVPASPWVLLEGVGGSFDADATDSDIANGDLQQSLSFSISTLPAGAAFDTATGEFSWIPAPATAGTYELMVGVSDGITSTTTPLTIVVLTANQPPSFTKGADPAVLEDCGPQSIANWATDISAGPDESSQTVAFRVTANSNEALFATLPDISPTGTLTFTPAVDAFGSATIEVVLDDSESASSAPQTFVITVTSVNDPPSFTKGADQTVDEDCGAQSVPGWAMHISPGPANESTQAVEFILTAADTSLFSAQPAIDSAGALTFTPALNANGTTTVNVTIRDDGGVANGGSDTSPVQSFTIHINPVNDAPVLSGVPASATIDELVLWSFDADATDVDLPAQTLTFSLVSPPAGVSIDPSTGVVSWTPSEAQGPGAFTLTVRVSDGIAHSEASVNVTVNEVNVAPLLSNVPASATIDELVAWGFNATATDDDLPAQPLTFSLLSAPSGASINSSTGAFTWTPSEEQGPGGYAFTVRVSDGVTHAEQEVSVTVTEANAAPLLSGVPAALTADELTLITFDADATDSDLPPQTLTFSLVGAPDNATIHANTGVFSWTPTEAQGPGSYTMTVRVSDGVANTDREVTITVAEVNVAPYFSTPPPPTGESAELALITFTVSVADADLPAQALTVSLVNAPEGATIGPSTGVFTWTPSEAQGPGVYPFKVRVSDGVVNTDANVQWTVTEVNVAPILSNVPASATIDELVAWSFDADASDADIPAQTLTFSLLSAPAGASINSSSGLFTWTPSEAQGPGVYGFTVRVTDGVTYAEQTVSVTVNEVNAAPVLNGVPAAITADELTLVTFDADASDSDLPAQTLTFSLVGGPAGAAINATTGIFSWTPTEAQGPGSYPFTVRVSDGLTNSDQGVTITVNEVNSAPVASDIPSSATIDELVPWSFDANASDADLPAQTLTFSLLSAPSGAAIHPSTGLFTWTPTEAQGPGVHPFTVRVSDGIDHTDTPITVTVREVNAPPVLTPIGAKTVTWGSELSFTANATDTDLPANTLTYSLSGAAAGMSIHATTGLFTWTPASSQIGSTTVTVNVSDGSATASTSVSITVTRRATALVYDGVAGAQYSDPANLGATLRDAGNSLPIAGATVRFVLGGLTVDVMTGADGRATSTAILNQAPASLSVSVSFLGNTLYTASSTSHSYIISAEDARQAYAGALYVATGCITCSQAVVTLAATIRDVTAVSGDPQWDAWGGDIRNATVTFVDLDTMTDIATMPIGLVSSGNLLTGVATHDWTVNIGTLDSREFTIGLRVGGSYAAALAAEAIVTVVKPIPNFVSGSGHILLSDSVGLLAGDSGSKNNFGFGVRYNKSGKNLQGRLNIIFRATDSEGVLRTYQAKATALSSMAADPKKGTATITAKAVLQDMTVPASPEAVDGNTTIQITITDRGNPGTADSIGITIWRKKASEGLWFSSAWDGTRTVETSLAAGNLNIQ